MRACQATPRNNGLVAVQPRIWLFGRGAWADFLASLTGLDLKAHKIFSSYSFRLPPAAGNHNVDECHHGESLACPETAILSLSKGRMGGNLGQGKNELPCQQAMPRLTPSPRGEGTENRA